VSAGVRVCQRAGSRGCAGGCRGVLVCGCQVGGQTGELAGGRARSMTGWWPAGG
jgi:hypothetical protein